MALLHCTSLHKILPWLYLILLYNTLLQSSIWLYFYYTFLYKGCTWFCSYDGSFSVYLSVTIYSVSTWFYLTLLNTTMVSNIRRSSQAWKKRLKDWTYTCTFVPFLNTFFFLSTWSVIRQSYIGTLFRIQLLFEGWWLNNTRICVCKITFMNCLLSWEDSLHRPNFAFVNVYVTQSC